MKYQNFQNNRDVSNNNQLKSIGFFRIKAKKGGRYLTLKDNSGF
jgi:hypothetical protein